LVRIVAGKRRDSMAKQIKRFYEFTFFVVTCKYIYILICSQHIEYDYIRLYNIIITYYNCTCTSLNTLITNRLINGILDFFHMNDIGFFVMLIGLVRLMLGLVDEPRQSIKGYM
jgi:hypothetical protein